MSETVNSRPENEYPNVGIISWKKAVTAEKNTYEGTYGIATRIGNGVIGPISTEGAEHIRIASGRIRHGANGKVIEFGPGDEFVVAANSDFIWNVLTPDVEYECAFLDKPIPLSQESHSEDLARFIREKITLSS